MGVEHIGPAAQRFVDRRAPYDLNHNLALIKLAAPAQGALPTRDELVAQIASRLHFFPRLRRRLVFPPVGTGPAFLCDDPDFDLDYHVDVIDGERIGGRRANQILGTMLERPLARDKPLWEVWLVLGLEDDGMFVVAKAHHLIVDGLVGLQTLAAVLLDVSPDGMDVEPEPWAPPPLPSQRAAARESLGYRARRIRETAGALVSSVRDADRRRAELQSLRAVPQTVRDELRPVAPALAINAPIGMHRDVSWVSVPMHEVVEVAHAGQPRATVNDVILCLVAEGLSAQLRAMGATDPLPRPRVAVPISLMRRTGGRVTFDQKDAFMVIDLPLEELDERERLTRIRRQTEERKGREATVIEGLLAISFALPAWGQGVAGGTVQRTHNLVLSNIQGIDHTLYVRGHEVEALAALGALPDGQALRIVTISAQDQLTFGLTVDPHTIRDHEPLRQGIVAGLAALR